MKRFLLIFTICLLAVVAVCAVACTQSAQAATMDGYVRYNAITCESPLKWTYNLSNVSSYTQFFTERGLLYIGRGGSSTASLQNNVLTSSIVSTGGQYVYLDFKFDRETLINLVSLYNTYYGLSLPRKVSFTVNLDVLSAYYIVQCWGRTTINGGANATVALSASASGGIVTLTLDLDTYNYAYYSFLVQTYGSVRLNGVKLEPGDNSFTGFIYDDFRDNGYTLGYNDGRTFELNYLYSYNNGFVKASKYYDFSSSMYENTTVIDGKLSTNPFWNVSGLSVSFSQGINGGMLFTSSSSGGSFSTSDSAVALSPDPLNPNHIDVVHSFYIKSLVGTLTYNYTVDGNSVTYLCKVGLNIVPIRFNRYSGFNFSLSANGSCQLVAYKQEEGNIFTGFPFYSDSGADFSSGYNSGYSDGSLTGYDTGYDVGWQDGLLQGSSQGYNNGFADGKTEGYSLGLSTAQQGTFHSLLSAIIDVPVNALMSLLNYDFFGINMWNLVRFLLTISLFLAIVHLFTKGKFNI